MERYGEAEDTGRGERVQKIIGRKKKSHKASEHQEQATFVQWCRLNKIPIFAIPNGIFLKDRATAYKIIAKMKKEGLETGVPDLFIPIQTKKYSGLFIEMKVEGGTLSKAQKKWIDELNKRGYKAVVCYGAIEAMEALDEYLKEV